MMFREAMMKDIQQIQVVRNAVRENRLSNPSLITDADYEVYLFSRGKGWVYVEDDLVVGFSIVDLKDNNVWALFVHPDFEKKGIGKKLYDSMMGWCFKQTKETIWLGTSPGTRAAQFYKMQGWKETGMHGKKEIKFEMSYEFWESRK